MTEPLLKVRGVQTFYGKIQALKGIDMDVNPGEIVTLIGSNGAGKSTLMMTICGTPRARAGSIHFDGKDITKVDPRVAPLPMTHHRGHLTPTHRPNRLRARQSGRDCGGGHDR